MLEHLLADVHRVVVLLLLPAVGARDARTGVTDVLNVDALHRGEQFDRLPVETLPARVTRRVVGHIGILDVAFGERFLQILVDAEVLDGLVGVGRHLASVLEVEQFGIFLAEGHRTGGTGGDDVVARLDQFAEVLHVDSCRPTRVVHRAVREHRRARTALGRNAYLVAEVLVDPDHRLGDFGRVEIRVIAVKVRDALLVAFDPRTASLVPPRPKRLRGELGELAF